MYRARHHVTRRKVGKAYFYKARTRRESAFRHTLRSLLDTFCEGSAEGLLVRLIKAEELSENELLELKRIADEVHRTQKDGRGREKNES